MDHDLFSNLIGEGELKFPEDPVCQRSWRQRFNRRILKWLGVKGCEKSWTGFWSLVINRALCWLQGHEWLYITNTMLIGPASVEERRCRMCTRCDGFDELSTRLLEAPFAEPVHLGTYSEEAVE